MGVAFVTGMQGDDPRYLKVVSTPKHYAVHSGPEPQRHVFDARVSDYDLVHTYLAAFRAAVVEGKAGSIMCVYNSVAGVPGCASDDLLQKRLRGQWGFTGYVVSDCGAVNDIHGQPSRTRPRWARAAVAAVKAGTDLTCGTEYRTLVDEVKAGHITEAEIDRAVTRLFEARFRLGMFDPPARVPYARIPDHARTIRRRTGSWRREAAREAIVLLKNEGGCAAAGPLDPQRSPSSAPRPTTRWHCSATTTASPRDRSRRWRASSSSSPPATVRYALGATYTASTFCADSRPLLVSATGRQAGPAGRILRQCRSARARRSCAGARRAATSTWAWKIRRWWRPSAARIIRSAGAAR